MKQPVEKIYRLDSELPYAGVGRQMSAKEWRRVYGYAVTKKQPGLKFVALKKEEAEELQGIITIDRQQSPRDKQNLLSEAIQKQTVFKTVAIDKRDVYSSYPELIGIKGTFIKSSQNEYLFELVKPVEIDLDGSKTQIRSLCFLSASFKRMK